LAVKKYPKIVQADARGQIVIPKDIRNELKIDEGTGFYMYTISEEGILLKKIPAKELEEHKELLGELREKAAMIGIKKENVEKSVKEYKKSREGKMEII
jgi:AbrB family looped-hinge helix DNA binding protein